jgi:hypothetical protein
MWTIVNDFHIEKFRLPVILVTDVGDRLSGDVFVVGDPRKPKGHEEAPDLLDAPEPFFPLATSDGRTLLCAKTHVRELIVPLDVDGPSDWQVNARAEVIVHLVGGISYRGAIVIEQSSPNQRVLDYLNRLPHRFLPVLTAQEVILVNREFIVHVEQVN